MCLLVVFLFLFTFRNFTRTIVYSDFKIELAADIFFGVLDVTNIWCFFTLYQIPEPKLIDLLILNETHSFAFYDLTKITANGYTAIQNAVDDSSITDFFFVTDSDYGFLDIYEESFKSYIAP